MYVLYIMEELHLSVLLIFIPFIKEFIFHFIQILHLLYNKIMCPRLSFKVICYQITYLFVVIFTNIFIIYLIIIIDLYIVTI